MYNANSRRSFALKKKKRRKKPLRRLVNTQWAEEPRLMALLLNMFLDCLHNRMNVFLHERPRL